MNDESYRLARRALLSALQRLDEDRRQFNSETAPTQGIADEPSTQSPVIVVVLGEGSGVARETAAELKSSPAISHPSHQRYALPRAHAPGKAPRPCFIEPDRFCINSGCCESRGF
jgi:hypothetical protein